VMIRAGRGAQRAEHLVGETCRIGILASRRRLPFQPDPRFLEQPRSAEDDLAERTQRASVNETIEVAFPRRR